MNPEQAPKTNIEIFEETLADRDHEEALIINSGYDQRIGELMTADQALYFSISAAGQNEELKESIPLGLSTLFGYEEGKRAFRWWNYRTAYERDQQSNFSPENLEKLGAERKLMANGLIDGDAIVVAWCAIADAARLRKTIKGEGITDIHTHEKLSAINLLLETFDKLLDGPQGKDSGQDFRTVRFTADGPHGPQDIKFNRLGKKDARSYSYTEFSLPSDSEGESLMDVRYSFEDVKGRLFYQGYDVDNNEIEVETGTILSFVKKIVLAQTPQSRNRD